DLGHDSADDANPTGAFEPWCRSEPLECLACLDQQRLRVVDTVVPGEPLGIFELHYGKVEGRGDLAPEPDGPSEQPVGGLGVPGSIGEVRAEARRVCPEEV